MVKTVALVCAAMMTFSASGFGVHRAGWFGGATTPNPETRQVQNTAPLNSEAAMRYRTCQQTSWRQAMTVR